MSDIQALRVSATDLSEVRLVSDFEPVCLHHFSYVPARHVWLVFYCLHCGATYEPDEICRMLNTGMLGVEE